MTQKQKISHHKHNETWLCEEVQQHPPSCQKAFNISRAIARVTPDVLSAT